MNMPDEVKSPECLSCERAFLSESALSQHEATVHGDSALKSSGSKRKRHVNGASDSAAHSGTEKAEPMHACEPCSRPFAGERSLFQHATAVHGYDEAEDRAKSGSFAKPQAPYLLGTAPWEDGERRLVVVVDRETGTRVLKDYETQYKQTDNNSADSAAAITHAAHQNNSHGSSSTVSGLSCSACDRAFLSVRGLRDHAEAVHQDQALEATYDERRELVHAALRKSLNPGLSYNRVYAYISDMTDEFFVYQVESEEHYRKATYSIADDGVVTLGEGTPVRRRSVYETVGSE